MKKTAAILFTLAALVALSADKFIFSLDGQTVGSSPRELPTQGVNLADGRVIVGLHALTDAERGACGWYRILPSVAPVAHSNEVWRITSYTFAEGTATPVYTCSWKKVKPRTFSKLKIVAALMEAGVWPQVKAFIEQQGLYDLYLAAQDFSEDNAYFIQGKAALQQSLGWTDEQVEAILKKGVSNAR